jgi:flagellar basal body-associated protein FliL
VARKVKGKRTTRRKTRRTIKPKKTNRHNFYLLLLVLVIFLSFIVYYFNFFQQPQANEPTSQNQVAPTQQVTTPINVPGGGCTKDSQCFITFCKDQTEDCVNTSQLSYYSKNCKTYSDWVIEKQDTSRCACFQNACTMIK